MTSRCKYPNLTTIGITGTIGSGKSTVGKILEELGIAVIDSDEIVHALLESDEQVKEKIFKRFGATVFSDTADSGKRTIDRKALGKIVFNEAEAKKDLERILHPLVRDACRKQVDVLAKHGKVKIVANLVPLLFEAGLGKEYDSTWAVTTDEKILRERLAKRDNFSQDEITKRLALQLSQPIKAAMADKEIDNSKDVDSTRKQVIDLLKALRDDN